MTKIKVPKGEQLRVALFSGNYNYSVDGPVRALNRLVAFLERKGHEVLVVAPTKKQAAFKHEGTLLSVPSFPFPGRGEYRVGLGVSPAVRQRLEDFKPNLFHLAAPDLLGYKALCLAQKWNVPAVSSFHTRFDTYPRYYGMAFLEKYLTRYMRYFYHQCEQVYVPSDSMRDILHEQDMAKDMRIWTRGVDSTLFNPAKRDLEWRKSLGIEADELVICFVGRLVLEKGIDFMADVLDQLTANGVAHRALIIGDGPERKRLEKRLPSAHLLGYLGGEDLARAYASSDIFLNPSDTETFGNVTLEAMACGLPAVCADATGSRSLVNDGVSGFLVPPRDLAAYVRQLTVLAGDAELRRRMKDAALALQHDYDWDVIMQGLLTNYREAIDNYRGSRSRDLAA
jgi:phosphatidylinositol alpha 1,6-mannosyltransferase